MTFQFDFTEIKAAAVAVAKPANQLTEGAPEAPSISGLAELAAYPGSFRQGEWGERQVALFHARRKRCVAFGLADAEALAEKLARRDADHDDRRLCVECSHCRRSGCAARDAWLPSILQRCDNFLAAALEADHE